MTIILCLTGPHGAGKTGHVDELAEALVAREIDAQAWHHPSPPDTTRTPFARALWYAHARAVRMALAETVRSPRVLIVDRWTESTRAATQAARPREAAAMYDLANVEDGLYPAAATLYLDAPDDVLDARLRARHGRAATEVERAEADWMRDGVDPASVIDTDRPRAEVAADVLAWALGALGHEVRP